MTQVGKNSLDTRSTLNVGGKRYAYYSLKKAAAKIGDISRLPFSMKVLLENLLRFEDAGFTVSLGDVQAIADWLKNPATGKEIQYRPGRVLLQDFTGVPCVVDLAAMRDAIKAQADTGILHTSTLYLIRSQIELAEKIAKLSGIPDAKVFFTSSATTR